MPATGSNILNEQPHSADFPITVLQATLPRRMVTIPRPPVGLSANRRKLPLQCGSPRIIAFQLRYFASQPTQTYHALTAEVWNPGLPRHLLFQLFDVQLTDLAAEAFFGDRAGGGEVEIRARSRVEFRPAG